MNRNHQDNKWNRCLYVSGPLRTPDGEHGPFTPHGMRHNTNIAYEWGTAAWKAGWFAFIPHMNTQHMDGCGIPPAAFVTGDLFLIQRMMQPGRDAVLMLPNYELSTGAMKEMEVAAARGIAVIRVTRDICPAGSMWPNDQSVAYLSSLRQTLQGD